MRNCRKGISMKIIISLFASITTALSFAATPQVKNVKAFQQYPWGENVYISYEVEGDVAESAGSCNTPFLFVTAKDKTTDRTCVASYPFLSGDTGTAAGLHKIIWNISAQGVTNNSNNVVFTVAYWKPEYCVIDLSSGPRSSSYPISYLADVPDGGWTDEYKTTKLALRMIAPGTFKMGGSIATTISQPFYIGVFEVTQKQYSLVVGSNPSKFIGDKLPVESVSYNAIRGEINGAKWPTSSAVDSTSFMGKLRARTGLNFDLPTEAQWEYACRAGTATTFSYGDSEDGDYMWYKSNSTGSQHEVGAKQPNSWGLYDMHGNVNELCLDWFGTLPGGTDPKGPSSGSWRVLRGGVWYVYADNCTSSFRNSIGPSDGYNYFGFRLVRTVSDLAAEALRQVSKGAVASKDACAK